MRTWIAMIPLLASCSNLFPPDAYPSFANQDRILSEAKRYRSWKTMRKPQPIPFGVYRILPNPSITEVVVWIADGTFEAKFAGEVHQEGRRSSWKE